MSQRGGRCVIAPLLRHSLICLSQTSLLNKLAAVELSAGERKHFGLFQSAALFPRELRWIGPSPWQRIHKRVARFWNPREFLGKLTQNVLVIAAVAKGWGGETPAKPSQSSAIEFSQGAGIDGTVHGLHAVCRRCRTEVSTDRAPNRCGNRLASFRGATPAAVPQLEVPPDLGPLTESSVSLICI